MNKEDCDQKGRPIIQFYKIAVLGTQGCGKTSIIS